MLKISTTFSEILRILNFDHFWRSPSLLKWHLRLVKPFYHGKQNHHNWFWCYRSRKILSRWWPLFWNSEGSPNACLLWSALDLVFCLSNHWNWCFVINLISVWWYYHKTCLKYSRNQLRQEICPKNSVRVDHSLRLMVYPYSKVIYQV